MEDGQDTGSKPELVIAVVGAVGSDLTRLSEEVLPETLTEVGYSSHLIRLSSLLHETNVWKDPDISTLDKYIKEHQKAGNEFRKVLKRGDALGLSAIVAIRKIRREINNDPNEPVTGCAYILRSLKHPAEAEALRTIYGNGFFLIAAYSPRDVRVDRLAAEIAKSYHQPQLEEDFRHKAEELISIDRSEPEDLGQNVRDTFPLADAFVNASDAEELQASIKRFIEVLFGYPFCTPNQDEYVMFHAKASALRSSDLTRQVGAAIATKDGDIIALGTNEVPKAGGGLYWEGDIPDHRDFKLERDVSREMKEDTLAELLKRLKDNEWLEAKKKETSLEELIEEVLPMMKGTQLMNVGEFGRTVHAEMAALVNAARRGVSVNDQTLYTTTFPCSNCAKHIIAAGIKRVVYVEPYPKSLAKILHPEEIIVERRGMAPGKVTFEPYVGIAPRRYIDLFTTVDRLSKTGELIKLPDIKERGIPRFPSKNAHLAYVPREKEALDVLATIDNELESGDTPE